MRVQCRQCRRITARDLHRGTYLHDKAHDDGSGPNVRPHRAPNCGEHGIGQLVRVHREALEEVHGVQLVRLATNIPLLKR